MAGLLANVNQSLSWTRGRYDPDVIVDLPFVPSASALALRGPKMAYSRSSLVYCTDALGVLQAADPDVPCYEHDPAAAFAPLGLWLQAQSTNELRNSAALGADTGTDTLPTHWSVTGGGWPATMDVTGFGTEDGRAYVELRFNGNPTGVGTLLFETNGTVAAAQNDTWTASTFARLVAGDFTNVPDIKMRIRVRSDVATLGENDGANIKDSITGTLARFGHTATLANAATTNIRPGLKFGNPAGAAVDFTLRIYLPQCEESAFPSSPIPTSGIAVTRNADVLTAVRDAPGEGTLIAVVRAPDGLPAGGTVLRWDDGTDANYVHLRRVGDTARAEVRGNTGTVAQLDTAAASWPDGTSVKLALAWSESQNKVQLSVDGAAPLEAAWTDDFSSVPNALEIGSDGGSDYLGGVFGWLRVLKVARFDADLQAV